MNAEPPTDALDPVRAELMRAALADADVLLTEARRDADRTLAAATREAEAILGRARQDGAADGRAAARQDLTRARGVARNAELAVRGAAYAELRRRITARLRELCEADPAYGERLAARARSLLGPDARVVDHPDGGVLATAPGRVVDLGLPAVADRSLERMGAEAEVLWEP
ncbi:hypothetical protein KCMC57_up04610 [Kitasatospora sp. CMC57]|uniref:ATP synthase subunit E n=1 Tax=Kitasatospora sp. CMC57 TaxID=3231513 RepID=A0AB33JS09_9ACTN